MKRIHQTLPLLAAAFFTTGTAYAAPPANLAGTSWSIQVDRDVTTLVITNQGGPGGPGGPTCLQIQGDIGITQIRGWYCPATGRIHFRHNNLGSGATMQTFTGNVSDAGAAGEPLYMAGTVTVDNVGAGEFGEHNFSATTLE